MSDQWGAQGWNGPGGQNPYPPPGHGGPTGGYGAAQGPTGGYGAGGYGPGGYGPPPGPPPPGPGQGGPGPANTLAIVGLVLNCLGLFACCLSVFVLFTSLGGIVCAILALSLRSPNPSTTKGLANASVALAGASLVICVIFVALYGVGLLSAFMSY
ncbi:hypothetical protein [Allonocardiopsis opalescens]|uniref:DUF4190 domain-containing protein n=1 Tax=Allonocardiopsis opalescens TaxID=1144618 RepID=A0A2T0Q9U7_9ACTN|nr:hypothetical protein [Allonocardiopsis opalescens]PRY00669.1 hypothetical protein CLV72_102300 [Allonocardiopsis opalescens]